MYTIDVTRHLAKLSKLNFTDDELHKIHHDMADIITLMDKVKEIDKTELFELKGCAYTSLREDLSGESFAPSLILANAKNVKNQAFTVPKVI